LSSFEADAAPVGFEWGFPASAAQIIMRNKRVRVMRVTISDRFLALD
jgi:hypothetical protein